METASCRATVQNSFKPCGRPLDEVMTQIPLEKATPGVKAYMAELILKTAAEGQTTYEGLLAAASAQIQTVLSQLI
jgi:hypothetical protein